jgi:hypothetical protein
VGTHLVVCGNTPAGLTGRADVVVLHSGNTRIVGNGLYDDATLGRASLAVERAIAVFGGMLI